LTVPHLHVFEKYSRTRPPSCVTALFYTTIIVGSTALNAVVPLLFELACELSYPTGEGITNGVMTMSNNFFGLIFLFIFMIPDIGMLSSWKINQ
jgi:FLVCR family MFS transporter